MIHVAIIEDNVSLAQSMAKYLNDQEHIICNLIFSSLEQYLKSPKIVPPLDIILLDIVFDKEGISLPHIREIKQKASNTAKIVMVTGNNSNEYLETSMKNGADGYFLKGSPLPLLLNAILDVHKGGTYFSMEVANLIKKSFRDKSLLLGELTEREREMATLLIEGYTYEEVAKKIFVSINTVRHYVKSMYKKLHVHNKTQLRKKLVP